MDGWKCLLAAGQLAKGWAQLLELRGNSSHVQWFDTKAQQQRILTWTDSTGNEISAVVRTLMKALST